MLNSCFFRQIAGLIVLLGFCGVVWAQSAPESFVITSSTPTQTDINNVLGYGATGDYPDNNSYDLRFGQTGSGTPPENLGIDSFTYGNPLDNYTRVAPPTGFPFDRVIVNRVNNPRVGYEKVTAFFCSPTNPPSTASTLYFGCDYVDTMEGLINSYVLNRGSDNLFANRSTDQTVNNIERVDMILENGLGSVEPARSGFLLMERGGNDDFMMAAITSLTSAGEVATLGPLITGDRTTAWGATGVNLLSTVFQTATASGPLRPSQNITSQQSHGTFISFADLGMEAGDPIFGVALFPGDVDEDMDLIGLSDVPLDTNGASADDGGLDFMAGGGFFTAEGVPPPLADIVDVTAECGLGTNNSPITLEATILNSGVVTFEYWQVGVSTDWTPVLPMNGTLNPQTATPPQPTEFMVAWDTTGLDFDEDQVFQIRVTAEANFDLGTVETVLELNAQCDTLGTPVTLSSFDSQWQRSGLAVNWTTSSELGNLGFNLYAEDGAGEWTQLNDGLIGSAVIDSVEPQFYQWQGRVGPVARLFLEDIDVLGKTVLHGPYEIGGSYGRMPEVQAIDWDGIRSASPSLSGRSPGPVPGLPEVPARLLVEEEGVYRVSYRDMFQAGLIRHPVAVDDLVLQTGGQNVGFRLVGRGTRFGPGTELEFYGKASGNPYSRHTVHELSVAYSLGSRLATVNSSPIKGGRFSPSGELVSTGTAVYRQNRERNYSASTVADTPWSDTRMVVHTSPKSWDFDFTADNPVDEGARLRIRLVGVTDFPDFDPDHHVEIWLNDTLLDDIWFEGRVIKDLSYSLPAGLLSDGNNRLTLRLPGDSGAPAAVMNLIEFDVEYPRHLTMVGSEIRFEASGRSLKVDGLTRRDAVVYRLVDGRSEPVDRISISGRGPYALTIPGVPGTALYIVAQGDAIQRPQLRAGRARSDITSGQADYLMVSHPDFIHRLAPLVALHERQGRRVKIVDVFDIYAQFSGGQVDAMAIRDYIRATADRMGYQHVLLVGGDTYDYKNQTGSGSISFIPSLYTQTGDFAQFAPSDALLVDLNGDDVPDLPIGRMPVRTPNELGAVITKTLQYANRSYGRTAMVSADRQEPGVSYSSQSERFFEPVLDQWWIERAYLDELSVEQARTDLIAGINAGASATTFVGHSAYSVWTFDGLFSASDIGQLNNAGRPTAVVQWGCWNTYHVIPSYNTMGHQWVLTPNRGAALAMGSATFTDAHNSRQFGELLVPELLGTDATVGQAVTRAKQELALTNPGARDMILGWTILGDPALIMGDQGR